MFVDIIKVFLL